MRSLAEPVRWTTTLGPRRGLVVPSLQEAEVMVEYLALPAWNTPACSIEAWVAALNEAGGAASTRRESSSVCWFLAPTLDVEGYALIEEGHPSAINFELHAADPTHALAVITAAAHSLGWEIHEEGEDDEPDDQPDSSDLYSQPDEA